MSETALELKGVERRFSQGGSVLEVLRGARSEEHTSELQSH